jgi:hypothetical protein
VRGLASRPHAQIRPFRHCPPPGRSAGLHNCLWTPNAGGRRRLGRAPKNGWHSPVKTTDATEIRELGWRDLADFWACLSGILGACLVLGRLQQSLPDFIHPGGSGQTIQVLEVQPISLRDKNSSGIAQMLLGGRLLVGQGLAMIVSSAVAKSADWPLRAS